MSKRNTPPKTGLDAEPIGVRRIVCRLMAGEEVMKQHRLNIRGDKVTEYQWRTTGRTIDSATMERAIASGFVVPTSGDLFGMGDAQTYGARP